MPRIARQHQIENSCIFHVINRGILRQTIFHDDSDVSNFLEIAKKYKQKTGFLLYHWCIMPNHYHLVAEFFQPSLISKTIGACQQIYSLYYHRKYQTAGRLFQNRFKSQAIQKEQYLLACGRYAELNPVRAKLADYAWDWKWSSAKFYVNNEPDGITTPDPEWKEQPPLIYKQWLLDKHTSDAEQKIFSGSQSIIGNQSFRKSLIVKAGHAMPKPRGRPRKDYGSKKTIMQPVVR